MRALRPRPATPEGMLRRESVLLRARKAGGAVFVYFVLLALPAIWFGAALGVDFTRTIVAGRQMRSAAQAAALSGAYQWQNGETGGDPTKLDATSAMAAATETLCRAADAGVTHLTNFDCNGDTFDVSVSPDGTKVTVKVNYQVSGLVFVGLMAGSGTVGDEVSATSFVCNPALDGPTQGFCVRPTGWR